MLFAQNPKENSQLIPLKVGNYWVYSYSDQPNKPDTIIITKRKIIGSDTAYYYSGKLLMERNDTIYELNESEYPAVEYFPSDEETDYKIVSGTNITVRRTVTKLEKAYKVKGKLYSNCYQFVERMGNGFSYTIISMGIGIIEIETPYQIISLINYKVK
jgi:hypothetical protein